MKSQTPLIQSILPAALGCCLFLSGCATIVKGSKQKVPINSQPAGASVRVNGTESGVTPQTAELSRKRSHRVELLLSGYRTYEVVLEPDFNGWMIGNLGFGGLIGMAVDGSTGAGNTLKPEKVEAVLERQTAPEKRRR